ncbi:fasciclin domain-containing protein [Pedobacter faecalis]|uniref:fasciclin domain-containing protein n=1 Tax=Pedobacter faecalis TaxID=3041495 RepID=UPI00254CD8AA|nr:fasciclin domain-containing protein [Pedobacter sp. ELA7]
MKRSILFLGLAILFGTGCNKPAPALPYNMRDPKVMIQTVVKGLAGADSVRIFREALSNLSLSAEETADGITVLPPLNGEMAQGNMVGREAGKLTELTANALKDHIIKGVYNQYELHNGRTFTTLSGKTLKISRRADTVWVNGIQIGRKQAVLTDDQAIHIIKRAITPSNINDPLETTTFDITVWDSSEWSPQHPKGKTVEGALVELYKTQLDFTAGKLAYKTLTGNNGLAHFPKLKPGRYYIHTEMAGKSNVWVKRTYEGPILAGPAIKGIFQSDAEAAGAPTQEGPVAGNLRWIDLNGDNKIDVSDYFSMPYENFGTIDGLTRKADITIGKYLNR